jgi:adenylate cyclase class IV
VPDPAALRERLLAAGAVRGFAGLMTDVRWDRNGELLARDEVLRLRVFQPPRSGVQAVLGWKGKTGVTADGHKQRRELEYAVGNGPAAPEDLLEALGYSPVHTIERYVEYYRLGDTEARLEWYPRMDILIEIEGDAAGIESGIAASGLRRDSFTPEPLSAFCARYEARTGTAAAMSRVQLGGETPSWESR